MTILVASFIIGLIAIIWVIVHLVSRSKMVAYVSKYLFIWGIPLVIYQMILDYGSIFWLDLLLGITIIIAVVIFMLDLIFYIPIVMELIVKHVSR